MPSDLEIRSRARLMQTAFPGETAKPRLLLGHPGLQSRRAMNIAHRDIPLLPERMIGQIVLGQVTMNPAIVPIHDRMDFGHAILNLNSLEPLPA